MGLKRFFGNLTESVTLLPHVVPSLRGENKAFMFFPKFEGVFRFVSDCAGTWGIDFIAVLNELKTSIYPSLWRTLSGGDDPYVARLEMVPIRVGNDGLGSDSFTLESLERIVWEDL
jgi:hypothetical protein